MTITPDALVVPFYYRGDDSRSMRVVVTHDNDVGLEQWSGKDTLGVERWVSVDYEDDETDAFEWVGMVACALAHYHRERLPSGDAPPHDDLRGLVDEDVEREPKGGDAPPCDVGWCSGGYVPDSDPRSAPGAVLRCPGCNGGDAPQEPSQAYWRARAKDLAAEVRRLREASRPPDDDEPSFSAAGLYEEVVTELERGGFCAARDHIDKLFRDAVKGLASEGAAPPPAAVQAHAELLNEFDEAALDDAGQP